MKPLFFAKDQSGMTLVEVTLALGITAFAAVTIMGLLTVALGHNTDSAERAIFVNIYRNVTEAIKTTTESSDPSLAWTQELTYDREAVPTGATNSSAHYRAEISAQPSATWPGATSTDAWNVNVKVISIPKDQSVFERNLIFVKEPLASGTNP